MFSTSHLSILLFSILTALVRCTSVCDNLSNITSTLGDLQAFLDTTFDVIVIGGGTAGLALAVRLAETGSIKVGVIEAGVFHKGDPVIEVPNFAGRGSGNPTYDWSFLSRPQGAAGTRQFLLSRGKMLGGSSGLNFLAWTRASELEYDAFRRFTSTTEWDWNGLLEFFRKSEDISLAPGNPYPGISVQEAEDAAIKLPSVAGFAGPIQVSYNDFYPDVVSTVVETMNNLGLRTNAQPINGISRGVTNTRQSVDRQKGVRIYSPTGYLCPHPSLDSLHILLGAQATRILFTEENNELIATGVSFTMHNNSYSINSSREVVLSAGTIQTPQILELSGVGNSSILASRGLETLLDLPGVGENFQEHAFVGVQWQLKPGYYMTGASEDLLLNATFEAEQQGLYNATHGGMLAAMDSLTGYFALRDLFGEVQLARILKAFDQDTRRVERSSLEALQYPIQRAWLENRRVPYVELVQWSRGLMNVTVNKEYVTVSGGIMHPASRGSSHIKSADPLEPPDINPRFLDQESDAFILLQTLRFILDLGKMSPLSDIIDVQTSPDPLVHSDAALLEYIRNTVTGGDHLIGTAAMAPKENNGVVDGNLRVYGTQNLRVVDASIIPTHIATHTQATCYAIAEKESHIYLYMHSETDFKK